MQTSAMYNRLRCEEKDRPKQPKVSALAFFQLLPRQFTTATANKTGEELGIKERAVGLHLRTLYTKGYIQRLKKGVYCKVANVAKKYKQVA